MRPLWPGTLPTSWQSVWMPDVWRKGSPNQPWQTCRISSTTVSREAGF